MNNYLLKNIFNNSKKHTNVELLNMNTSNIIFKKKTCDVFDKLNSILLNENDSPLFLFQILELNICKNKSIQILSNFIDNWGNISSNDRLTLEYKNIYIEIKNHNKKSNLDFRDINLIKKKKQISNYYLNAKDSLYVILKRIENVKDRQIFKKYLIENNYLDNDIELYNNLNKLYFEPINNGINYKKDNSILEYNISKYGYLLEIIAACDHIFLLRKLKKKYGKKKIYIFKNFNYDEFNIFNNEILVKDYLETKTEFYGHTGMICIDFINSKLIYFDPDKIDKNYKSFIFINKISPLLKIAFNKKWTIRIINNESNNIVDGIQDFYCDFHSNFDYSCTIISCIFGILSCIFPNESPDNIFKFIIYKTKINNNKIKFIKSYKNKKISGGRQLLQWINNLFQFLK